MDDENLQRVAARMRKIGEKTELIQTVERLRITARQTARDAVETVRDAVRPQLKLVEAPAAPRRDKAVGTGFRSWMAEDLDTTLIAAPAECRASVPAAMFGHGAVRVAERRAR